MGIVLSFVCSEIRVPISDEPLNHKLIGIMSSVSFEKPWRMKRTILIRPYIAYFQTEQGLNGRLNVVLFGCVKTSRSYNFLRYTVA